MFFYHGVCNFSYSSFQKIPEISYLMLIRSSREQWMVATFVLGIYFIVIYFGDGDSCRMFLNLTEYGISLLLNSSSHANLHLCVLGPWCWNSFPFCSLSVSFDLKKIPWMSESCGTWLTTLKRCLVSYAVQNNLVIFLPLIEINEKSN